MKTAKWGFLPTGVLSLFIVGSVSAQTTNLFTQTVGQPVPASTIPLSSSIDIGGVSGVVSDIQVKLNITGGFNGDLYCYLLNPAGNIAILLNRPGVTANNAFGYSEAGFDITLSDGAANVHDYQAGGFSLSGDGQLTGTWAPDGRNLDPQSGGSAFDGASTASDFSIFNGTSPDGIWELEIASLAGGDGSSAMLQTWAINVVTSVPEPQVWALGACGIAALLTRRMFRKTR